MRGRRRRPRYCFYSASDYWFATKEIVHSRPARTSALATEQWTRARHDRLTPSVRGRSPRQHCGRRRGDCVGPRAARESKSSAGLPVPGVGDLHTLIGAFDGWFHRHPGGAVLCGLSLARNRPLPPSRTGGSRGRRVRPAPRRSTRVETARRHSPRVSQPTTYRVWLGRRAGEPE